MQCFLLLIFFAVSTYAQSLDNLVPSLFSTVSNTTEAPLEEPPSLQDLPSLETISSILNATNTLEDIKSKFEKPLIPYENTNGNIPSEKYIGVWWRFYTENSKLFDIPSVSEEVLVIETNGRSFWLQNIKTKETLESRMQRLLIITQYNLFGHDFFVFHYADQDPRSQEIRNKQGFFMRSILDQGYLQMSKSPNFESDRSIYWKKFPTINKNSASSASNTFRGRTSSIDGDEDE
ncbi:MAG: hypothetical protein ACRCTJ_01250 [Brevinema sp.]